MPARILIALLLVLPSWAGEYVVLSNGFRIRAERHERNGGQMRFHTAGGVIEIPAAQVAAIEPEDYVAPQAQPAEAAKQAEAPVPAAKQPASGAPADPKQIIAEAAGKWGLPAELVHSVAKAESAYRTDAVSPKGAVGVMQLMPSTAQALNADPRDPRQNIEAGVRLLRELLIKYDNSATLALAAYNAGAGAVDRYKTVPPYRETQLYVQKVLRDYERQTKR